MIFFWYLSLPFVYIALAFKILSAKRKAKKYLKNKDEYLASERYDIVYSLAKMFLYTKNIRIKKLLNEDQKILSKPQLVVANHRSNLDPILVFVLLYNKTPVKPVFIAKQELKETYLSFIYDLVDTIYIDRNNLRQMYNTIQTQVDLLKDNRIVVVFPEGTRNDTNELLEFKSGAIEAAYRTNAPILPIIINGQEDYFEKAKEIKRKDRREIKIKILPIFQHPSFLTIDRNIFAKKMREKMQDEFNALNK